jgi:aspartate racemase
MEIIGLLGGMSWESSAEYYRLINELVRQRLGRLHSAEILMYSVNFEPIEQMQHRGAWDEAEAVLVDAAKSLEAGGATFLVICTNTMHKLAEGIGRAVRIPILHIADATAVAIKEAGLSRIGLLATRFTMEDGFYRGRLEAKHGIGVIVPREDEREIVHRVIYEELCLGEIREESKRQYLAIIDGLIDQGAEGIVLGCTEIGLLLKPSDVAVPVFDTTRIHARAAVDRALAS